MSTIGKCCKRAVLTILVAFGLAGSAMAENPRLAVFDFDTLGPDLDAKLGRAVAQVLQVSLVNQKKYDIVERSHLAKIVAEQDLQLTGMVDPQTCIKLGKLAGVQFAVVGSVMRFGKTYVINWAIVDVQTAKVEKGENMVFATEDLLPAVCQKLGTALVEDTEGAQRQTLKSLFADTFKNASLDKALWDWGHTNKFSYKGTGTQRHQVSTKDGYLLIEARADHEGGWTSVEDIWVDTLIDLRSDDDVIIEVELAAKARCGFVEVKLSESRDPESRGDPASITLFSAQGEKHNPLSMKKQKIRIEVCGSARMATLYTQNGMLPDFTNVDLSALKSWRLRFYASAGTSAGFPPASAVLKLYAVRAARVESKPAIAGRIVDRTTNRGIPGAAVRIKGQGIETTSNLDGTYVLLCPPGKYTVETTVADYAQVRPAEVTVAASRRTVANIPMKRTKFGYGDVVSVFSVGKDNCCSIAVSPNSIFYLASNKGEKLTLFRARLDGSAPERIGELPAGGGSGLGFVDGALYGTEWWPGRIYRISANSKSTLVRRLDIDWPRGLAFDGSNFWYLETSSIDNRYGAYAMDIRSGRVVLHLEGRDTKISGIAWGNDRLWVSSLKGQVYEVDVNRAKREGSLEAGIVRKFAGQYDRLSYEGGYLWGLDGKAKRICKINLDEKASE